MPEPRSLAEIPFPRRDARALLNLPSAGTFGGRAAPDLDYAGFGWATAEAIVLCAEDGARLELTSVLLLALHSADAQKPVGSDVTLEFELEDDHGGPLSVLAPLGAFLREQLPRLPKQPHDVVLALCNPRGRDLLAVLPEGRRFHFASGDVFSWLDCDDAGHARIRLQAQAWHHS